MPSEGQILPYVLPNWAFYPFSYAVVRSQRMTYCWQTPRASIA